MDATEKSVCITQPSCEDLKILQGQIVKEQKTKNYENMSK
jgi:hypothetical protein